MDPEKELTYLNKLKESHEFLLDNQRLALEVSKDFAFKHNTLVKTVEIMLKYLKQLEMRIESLEEKIGKYNP
jgi:hypothetical protein